MELTKAQRLLKEHKIRKTNIARSLGVSHTAVCLVAKGISKSARISKAISEAVGVPVSELWPEIKGNNER